MKNSVFFLMTLAVLSLSCSSDDDSKDPYTAIRTQFGSAIDPENLPGYASQTKPAYITRDNSGGNTIDNARATLGRVLFYDTQLSIDNTIACANCHRQESAFGAQAEVSKGVAGGRTARHSMRLVNARFANEVKFFWDERAPSLEDQTTRPIRDHAEMGFSGVDGRPSFSAVLEKLQAIGYYQELFKLAYGDTKVTEARMQQSLAQFVRSIQSFDSKYDAGRIAVNADNQPFPNFSQQENQGKNIFLAPPQFDQSGSRTGGGAGCAGCHAPPEFDIAPNSGNNGVTGKFNSTESDFSVTRAPSLRDLIAPDGFPHGPMMHDASKLTVEDVIEHYNAIPPQTGNTNLDPKLRPNGSLQKLNLTLQEKQALVAFLKTLTGSAIYSDTRWSSPFQP
ncbi:MAG: cytochrome-c peroxidase [Bacteroidota bacterium]